MNDREILDRLWEANRETPFASFTLERKLNLTKSEYRDVLNLLGDMADSGETQNGYRIKRVASTVYKMTQAQQGDGDSLKGLPLIDPKESLTGQSERRTNMKEQHTSVKYTRSEIDTLPDETDWECVDALTDEDIDAAAASDPDAPPTDASFWKDATVVMPENMEEYTQRQIMGIINKIVEKSSDGSYIYRGEPKCHKTVSSSLWRLLQVGDGIGMTIPNIKQVRDMFLEDARRYARDTDIDDFELEAQLQHNGGKTSLIDFTTDCLIALFFACDGKPGEDGRVILLKQDETTKDWIKKPKNPEHRVIAQKSIFVQPTEGFIEGCRYGEPIKIRKDLKKNMLD